MARTIVQLAVQNKDTPQDERTVLLGEGLVKKHKIPIGQPITLRFGSTRLEVIIKPVSRITGMLFKRGLAAKLGLHQGVKLCLNFKSNTRVLSIGPLIGVMVTRMYRKVPDRPFGSVTNFCREFTDACAHYGAHVFFFTPEDINANPTAVPGWSWQGAWHRRSFPVPDVVYNRLTSRRYENRPNVQQFMKDVKAHHGTVVFNEKYLNKAEVFDALRQEESLRDVLPESHLLKNYQMLKSMFSRYPTLFLKPIGGSLGIGIIRVRRDAKDAYSCHYATLTGTRRQSFQSLPALFKTISGKLKTRRYQIQQGLHLAEVNGRPIDFRALVQRDGTGTWKTTSVVCRTAGAAHFVSNLARGGTLSKVPEALMKSNVPAGLRTAVHAKLRRRALDIAKGIDTKINAHFAELGVDLAVDNKGKVWLLEVNSKPSKDDNTPLASEEGKIRPSVKCVVQYCLFAAQF